MTLGNTVETIIFLTIRSELRRKPKSKSGMQEITYTDTLNAITRGQVDITADVLQGHRI